ncbi:flavin reductase family protein [Gordonia sp. PKS22-38]|uniref:Flavin reductase family protein n=1 Tax=Gordonia prachuapensis TaxID=3115651 RepID=A0ABU7MVL9_9ACTN|nr:flavin reductase family protein [Gordonia sp. PKS22-38]
MSNSPVLEPIDDDPTLLRNVYGGFPSGVTAICAMVDGIPVGIAASAFTSVSMSPPLVSVCVQNSSRTWPTLRLAQRLGVSVLSADHETVCRSLSAREGDRFADVPFSATADGAIVIDGAVSSLACELVDEVPAGDHHIAMLRIHALHTDGGVQPLVFHRSGFHRLARAA